MSAQKKVLVTGAQGFIGRFLCAALKEKDYFVRGSVRSDVRDVPGIDEYIQVADINGSTDWQEALAGVDTVIHLAGRAHFTSDPAADPAEAFRKINVLGTGRLARMAAEAGVKRFIFISSVKVNGEASPRPYTEKDIPAPRDAYGISKREAEDLLRRIAAETGLQTVILRLPLVYGPGVKANFKGLVSICAHGLPLPLKNIDNRRSFIYLGNLADAILTCMVHPQAAGQVFLLSDGQDMSTSAMLSMIAQAMHKKPALFSMHPGLLAALAKITGKTAALEKLTGSLTVDSSKIRTLLSWKPPFTAEEGIRETVKKRC